MQFLLVFVSIDRLIIIILSNELPFSHVLLCLEVVKRIRVLYVTVLESQTDRLKEPLNPACAYKCRVINL